MSRPIMGCLASRCIQHMKWLLHQVFSSAFQEPPGSTKRATSVKHVKSLKAKRITFLLKAATNAAMFERADVNSMIDNDSVAVMRRAVSHLTPGEF